MSDDKVPVHELMKRIEGSSGSDAFLARARRLQHVYPRDAHRIAEEVCAMRQRLLDLIEELEEAVQSNTTVKEDASSEALRDATKMLQEVWLALQQLGGVDDPDRE